MSGILPERLLRFGKTFGWKYLADFTAKQQYVPEYELAFSGGPIRQWYMRNIYPFFFKFYVAPRTRFAHAHYMRNYRRLGCFADDVRIPEHDVLKRAELMLPQDILADRERRKMRSYMMTALYLTNPVEEQNFDPFLPILAPYWEEAKFQYQEEEELIAFHQWDRAMGSVAAGTSGLGEKEKRTTYFTLIQ